MTPLKADDIWEELTLSEQDVASDLKRLRANCSTPGGTDAMDKIEAGEPAPRSPSFELMSAA